MKKFIRKFNVLLALTIALNGAIYAYGSNKKTEYIDLNVAAEVLDVSAEELEKALETKSLYELLDDASKVRHFKRVMIREFSERVNAEHESGKINKTKAEKLIQRFSEKMNAWEG